MFILYSGTHEDHRMDGLFTTREKAEGVLAELQKIRPHCVIEEAEPDLLVGRKAVPQWKATVDVETGQLLHDKDDGSYKFYEGISYNWEDEGHDFDTFEWVIRTIPYRHSGYIPRQIHVLSRKSQEVAWELALAAWAELNKRLDFSKIYHATGSIWYPKELAEKLYEDGICKFHFEG